MSLTKIISASILIIAMAVCGCKINDAKDEGKEKAVEEKTVDDPDVVEEEDTGEEKKEEAADKSEEGAVDSEKAPKEEAKEKAK